MLLLDKTAHRQEHLKRTLDRVPNIARLGHTQELVGRPVAGWGCERPPMYQDRLQHGHGAHYQTLDRKVKGVRYHIDDAPGVGRCTSAVRRSPSGATRCTQFAVFVSSGGLGRTPCSRRWEGLAWHVGQQSLTTWGDPMQPKRGAQCFRHSEKHVGADGHYEHLWRNLGLRWPKALQSVSIF